MLHRLELPDVLQQQQHVLYGRQAPRLRKTQDSDTCLSSTLVPPLLRFRSELSSSVWDSIVNLFPHQEFPEALDIDCTYGKAAIELARRGFRVTGIEPDVQLLARARLLADVEGVALQLLGADQEKQRLASGSAQLVSVIHGFHLLHAASAMAEVHRLLQPGGYLVAAWNDRDTSDVMVQDLEDVMEGMSPTYERSQRLHDPEAWLPILTQGGLFELQSFEQHSNMLRLRQVAELVELMGSMRFMQAALEDAPEKKKLFAREVRALATRHFQNFDDIQLPLVSKLYIMKRVG